MIIIPLPPADIQTTLVAAQERLAANIESGTSCPCCGQFAKLYARNLNKGMAGAMVGIFLMSRQKAGDWVHVNREIIGNSRLPDFVTNGAKSRDFSVLRFWGLIEERINIDKVTRTSGQWKLTEHGVGFVLGRSKVHKTVVVYNNQAIGFSGDMVDVSECLGSESFRYDEIMKGRK